MYNQAEAMRFVQSMVEIEIENTREPQTLFRGNSMGSKSLDLYMKFVAGGNSIVLI